MTNLQCDLTDFKCVVVNELIGDPILTVILLGVALFLFASYNRWGIKTTIWTSIVFFPLVSYFVAGTGGAFAFITFFVAVIAAIVQSRIVRNS